MKTEVIVIPTHYTQNDNIETIYPAVLRSGEQLLLIDCGYPGFLSLLEDGLNNQGLSLSNLTGLILTHHDIDHVGTAAEIALKYPHIKVYAPAIEEKWISGKEKPLRLQQAEKLYETIPDEYKAGARAFQDLLKKVKPVNVNVVLQDGDVLLENVRVVETSGHTPGHISLFLEDEKLFLAADALVINNEELEIANPQFAINLQEAIHSVKKIKLLAPKKILCYHGGILEQNVQEKLNALLQKYNNNE